MAGAWCEWLAAAAGTANLTCLDWPELTPKAEYKTRFLSMQVETLVHGMSGCSRLLQQAVQAAPLEFSSLWACCVRFAVHSLSESGSDALGSLLDSISAPIGNGELSHLAKSCGIRSSADTSQFLSEEPCKQGPCLLVH